MWLFQQFIKDPAKAALAHRVRAKKEISAQEEGKLTRYCQVVNYLVGNYASDDAISGVDAEVTNFKQPEKMSVERFSEVLWEKALRCGPLYDESSLKGVFIEGLNESICFSMGTYLVRTKMQLSRSWHDTPHVYQSDRREIIVPPFAATIMLTPEDDKNSL